MASQVQESVAASAQERRPQPGTTVAAKPSDFAAVWAEADAAAKWAVSLDNPDAPREQPMAMDCGFAWVCFPDGRHPFVRWCRKANKGEKHWKRGWLFWMSGYHNGQSIGVHQAAAHAFAAILDKHFPDASVYATGRLD
jgi:hypothetical protein